MGHSVSISPGNNIGTASPPFPNYYKEKKVPLTPIEGFFLLTDMTGVKPTLYTCTPTRHCIPIPQEALSRSCYQREWKFDRTLDAFNIMCQLAFNGVGVNGSKCAVTHLSHRFPKNTGGVLNFLWAKTTIFMWKKVYRLKCHGVCLLITYTTNKNLFQPTSPI